MDSTFRTLLNQGLWCDECAKNCSTIADWLSEPGKPITTDVVVGLACAFAIETGISVHACLQKGAEAAAIGRITPL